MKTKKIKFNVNKTIFKYFFRRKIMIKALAQSRGVRCCFHHRNMQIKKILYLSFDKIFYPFHTLKIKNKFQIII